MNLWLTGILSNQGYIVHHPVHRLTLCEDNIKIREKDDMINHLGTASFARMLLWGYHTYTEHDLKCFPPDYHYKKDVEGSRDGLLLLKGSRRKKSSNAFMNTKDTLLPDVKQIQDFLKKSIQVLSGDDFQMLQSLLLDCQVLQKGTRPFSLKTKQIFGGTYEESTPKQPETKNVEAPLHEDQTINAAWKYYKDCSGKIGDMNYEDADNSSDQSDEQLTSDLTVNTTHAMNNDEGGQSIKKKPTATGKRLVFIPYKKNQIYYNKSKKTKLTEHFTLLFMLE